MNPVIFRSYDIHGEYGKDFDAAFVRQLGSRVASYTKSPMVVVARDQLSVEPAAVLMDGVIQVGAQVVDVGVVSLPQFRWALRYFDAYGVFASQGFQVFEPDGQVVSGHHLRQIYDSHTHQSSAGGRIQACDIVPAYARALDAAARWSEGPLPVAIQAPASVHRAIVAVASIAPTSDMAIQFNTRGELSGVYRQGRPWHDWASHISAQAVEFPELAVFELIKKTTS